MLGLPQTDDDDGDDDDVAIASRLQQENILLILADSNLPTGGFVASSGLESFWAHGLMSAHLAGTGQAKSTTATDDLVALIASSLDSYASMTAGYLLDAFRITHDYMHAYHEDEGRTETMRAASAMQSLDSALHAMMLNHVAQRASKAQGVALLTLYAKSFAPVHGSADATVQAVRAGALLQELKLRIRRGECHGHLPICWAAFIAAVGVDDAKRALSVHLFLQVRAILSAAVRLNIVGPYLSHRILTFDAQTLIASTVKKTSMHTVGQGRRTAVQQKGLNSSFEWTWTTDGSAWDETPDRAPKTTWPLGDLLQGRHDQLHSRLFNS